MYICYCSVRIYTAQSSVATDMSDVETSDSSESIEVIIVHLSTETASNMRMHLVLVILTVTFLQGHTNLNHENNECFLIYETFHASPSGLL